MTIAAGFVARDGILLCSDTQYTAADKTYRPKIVFPKCDLEADRSVTFAFCGDEDYAKSTIDDCLSAINNLASGASVWTIRNSIRQAISAMSKEYKAHQQVYGDYSQVPQFLVTIRDSSGRLSLFSGRDAAMASVSSYACIGTGSYIGNYIASISQPSSFSTITDLIPIAIQMLAAAKKHDLYCGGGSHFMAIRGTERRGYYFSQGSTPDMVLEQYALHSGQVL
jgi:hypothetical protein